MQSNTQHANRKRHLLSTSKLMEPVPENTQEQHVDLLSSASLSVANCQSEEPHATASYKNT
jgi:hypothetical protein